MPQVASALVIPPQRPEPAARTTASAAASDSAGRFGGMLDASAGPDPSGAGSPNQPGKADGAGKSKPADQPKSADDAAQAAAADAGGVQTAASPEPDSAGNAIPPASPVDLAILAQAVAAGSGGASTAEVKDAGNGAADPGATTSDPKADGSDDATPSIANPDVTAVAVPAASIVAVAVVAAPAATPPAAQPDAGNADNSPSVGQASTPTSINSPPTAALQLTAATPADVPPVGADQNSAPGKSEPAAATAALAPAAPQDSTSAAGSSDEAVNPGKPTISAVGPTIVSATADGTQSDKPGKPGEPKTAGIAQAQAKLSPQPDQQIATLKTEGDESGAKAVQARKIEDVAHGDAKAAQPKPLADAAHPARAEERNGDPGHTADQDLKGSAAHQTREPGPDHAAASPRVAFAAAHGDATAPTAAAPAVNTQPGTHPSALGLTLAPPLASPLAAIWQASSQPADASDKTVPVAGLAVEIVSRAQDGLRRFDIRLDPPELGRIDVRLDVDNGGNVTSRLTVDRPETLDLLRRDAPQLERALQHAGLNTEGGLQFSLRDQNFANRDQMPRGTATHLILPDDEPAAAEAARRGYGRLLGMGAGIDIRV